MFAGSIAFANELRIASLRFTDDLRTIERGRMSVLSPEATPDKALRIFATLVRDQEVDGSNPFAPTIFLPQFHDGSDFVDASLWALSSSLCPILCPPSFSSALSTASSDG